MLGGVAALLTLVSGTPNVWAFAPGLLLIGLGLGVMLTPSVNIVQSAFAEQSQGEISGLSRSVSNLGSSLGAAVAGTVLVAGIPTTPERSYALAMIVLAAVGCVGLAAAVFLPRTPPSPWHHRTTTGPPVHHRWPNGPGEFCEAAWETDPSTPVLSTIFGRECGGVRGEMRAPRRHAEDVEWGTGNLLSPS